VLRRHGGIAARGGSDLVSFQNGWRRGKSTLACTHAHSSLLSASRSAYETLERENAKRGMAVAITPRAVLGAAYRRTPARGVASGVSCFDGSVYVAFSTLACSRHRGR